MDDSELVQICNEEIRRGYGGTEDDSSNISDALDYYFSRKPGITNKAAKDPDSSRYVSPDVMNAVESTTAEIIPTFTTKEVAFYPPDDERDEGSARTETELVNYLFLEEYDGWSLIQQAIKDSLLHGNCTFKVYWDERKEVSYDEYMGLDELALQQVMQPTQEGQEVEIVEQEVIEQMSVQVDPMGMQIEVPSAIYNIKLRRTSRTGNPSVESVAQEDLTVCGDHDKPVLYDVRFAAQSKMETASSLIAQGVPEDIVERLPAYSNTSASYSRSRSYDETEYSSASDTTKLIEVMECYILVDFDGDGIAERRKVVISGNELLFNDEWDTVNLIGGVASIMPHKYRGISQYERIRQVQDVKTYITRSIIDGTKLSSNPRVGVLTGEVNLDDMLTSRTGGIVRMDNPNGIIALPNPEVPQSSYQLLTLMDGDRGISGASAIDTAAQAQMVQGDTAHGIERVMSAMEMNNAVIARTLGETLIRGVFVELHKIIRKNYEGVLQVKTGGKWITSIPSEWKERTSVNVNVGSSHAERQRKASNMINVLTYQEKLAAARSPLINDEKGYNALTDLVFYSGNKNPDRYFVDPSSEEGQAAINSNEQEAQADKAKMDEMNMAMAQAQQQIAEAETMKGQAALQSQQAKLQVEQMKSEINGLKELANANQKDAELQYKYTELEVNSVLEREKNKTDEALKLTELEMQSQKELNEQYNDTRKTDSEIAEKNEENKGDSE